MRAAISPALETAVAPVRAQRVPALPPDAATGAPRRSSRSHHPSRLPTHARSIVLPLAASPGPRSRLPVCLEPPASEALRTPRPTGVYSLHKRDLVRCLPFPPPLPQAQACRLCRRPTIPPGVTTHTCPSCRLPTCSECCAQPLAMQDASSMHTCSAHLICDACFANRHDSSLSEYSGAVPPYTRVRSVKVHELFAGSLCMSALLHALCKRGHCIPVTLMSAIERCTYCREDLWPAIGRVCGCAPGEPGRPLVVGLDAHFVEEERKWRVADGAEVLISGQPCVHASNANTTRRDAADPSPCLDAQAVLRSARSKSVLIVENVARYFTDPRWAAAVSDLCRDGWVILTGSRGSGSGGADALHAAIDAGAAESRTRYIFVAVRRQVLPRPRMRHDKARSDFASLVDLMCQAARAHAQRAESALCADVRSLIADGIVDDDGARELAAPLTRTQQGYVDDARTAHPGRGDDLIVEISMSEEHASGEQRARASVSTVRTANLYFSTQLCRRLSWLEVARLHELPPSIIRAAAVQSATASAMARDGVLPICVPNSCAVQQRSTARRQMVGNSFHCRIMLVYAAALVRFLPALFSELPHAGECE